MSKYQSGLVQFDQEISSLSGQNFKSSFLGIAFAACIDLLIHWLDNKENNPTRIALLVCCVAISTGFSKFYATFINYKKLKKEAELKKKK